MKSTRAGLVGLALFAATGCAANDGGGAAGGDLASAVSRDMVPIHVQNETSVTLRVAALYAGIELPLGRVEAMGERTFRFPRAAAAVVQLVAKPGADRGPDRRHVSEPISVTSGHRITWQLRASPGVSDVPRLSTVRIFACRSDAPC